MSLLEAPQYYLLNGTEIRRTETVFEGALNDNWLYAYNDERYVLRIPKPEQERKQVIDSIQAEYDGIGATAAGIHFRLRSPEEQAAFIDLLLVNGIKTVNYLACVDNLLVFPFVEAIRLDEFLHNPDFSIVENVVAHLIGAHEKGLVLGDRWGKNTLVLPNHGFAEIDFDIELMGNLDILKAFELSQLLYHIAHFAKDRQPIIDRLTHFLENHGNITLIQDFLEHQTEYFLSRRIPYEGITPPSRDEMKHLYALQSVAY